MADSKKRSAKARSAGQYNFGGRWEAKLYTLSTTGGYGPLVLITRYCTYNKFFIIPLSTTFRTAL